MNSVWDVLEIPRGSDRDTIRRAYAKKLRVTHPEDDPDGFKRLREAYEAALQHHDYAVRWAEYDEEEEGAATDTGPADDAESSGPGDAETVPPAPSPYSWSGPADPSEIATPAQSSGEPEIDAMLAAREGELAALRAAMDSLAAGLNGPWRPSDAELEQRLHAVLRSPAMEEIRVRSDVEPWLADLLASTIPYSDAVLLQSIQAFGWGSGDHHSHHVSWSVSTVLGRFEEWRIIEGLNHHSHAYHASWRSLTRPPGAWWSWRIDAFRPGLTAGVETLLGEHGDVSPGLHYSFKSESVERWKAFLAKPRLTLGMLAMVPIAFLATLWLGYVVAGSGQAGESWMIVGAAAIGLATPAFILFTLSRWQLRWRAQDDHPRWQREGWLAAFAALALVAMAMPRPHWPAVVALPALLIAAWAYVAAPRTEPRSLAMGGGVTMVAVACFFSLAAIDQLASSEFFAIAIMAMLLVYLRVAVWSATKMVLEELLWQRREWTILGIVIGGIAIATGMWWLRSLSQPIPAFFPVALAAIALVPLVGAPVRGEGPSRAYARGVLLLAFIWALGASLPPKNQPATGGERSRSEVPLAEGPGDIDTEMAALERNQPGFRQMRDGNPPLYAEVRAIVSRYSKKEIDRDTANAEIDTLVDDAYRRMAPDADSGLLVEGLRIRLERQKALRGTNPTLCASGDGTPRPDDLPRPLIDRQTAQIYNVITNPPASAAEIKAGHVLGNAEVARRVAAALKTDQATLVARVKSKGDPWAACEVRIAVTQAILDNRLDDIAATLRKDLREIRDAKPAAKPARAKADPKRTV